MVLYHHPAEKLLTPLKSSFKCDPPAKRTVGDSNLIYFLLFARPPLLFILQIQAFVPCIILPMSSSSDVIDLERRAMAGGVSLLVCCGAAKRSQPNADLMFSILV